ncbi:MAG: 50S ribosomal protein L14e [Sulfolobales archaeon]|nr:50S ribosomal protein L14e [Sulfolobales archaeon]MDW8082841.1 50S ribosomal protein L14e [Sulfolobales archaeon]
MPVVEVGRVCVKIAGREAGRKAVIVDLVDENFVVVTGPKNLTGVKRRKVNVKHIEILDRKVEISRSASDEEVLKALETAGLTDFMKERVRLSRREILATTTLISRE